MIRLFRSSKTRRSLAFMGLVGGISLAMITPSFAASGSGSGGSGTLTVDLAVVNTGQSGGYPCAETQSDFADTFSISSGTYSHGNASYTGPVTLTWAPDSNGPYNEGPDGTHGTDSTCDPSTLGDTWGVNAAASGTNSQGSTVSCTYTGTYSRVDTAMSLSLDGTCSIQDRGTDGSNGVTNNPTHEDRSETLGTCTGHNGNDPNVPLSCATSSDSYTATNN